MDDRDIAASLTEFLVNKKDENLAEVEGVLFRHVKSVLDRQCTGFRLSKELYAVSREMEHRLGGILPSLEFGTVVAAMSELQRVRKSLLQGKNELLSSAEDKGSAVQPELTKFAYSNDREDLISAIDRFVEELNAKVSTFNGAEDMEHQVPVVFSAIQDDSGFTYGVDLIVDGVQENLVKFTANQSLTYGEVVEAFLGACSILGHHADNRKRDSLLFSMLRRDIYDINCSGLRKGANDAV